MPPRSALPSQSLKVFEHNFAPLVSPYNRNMIRLSPIRFKTNLLSSNPFSLLDSFQGIHHSGSPLPELPANRCISETPLSSMLAVGVGVRQWQTTAVCIDPINESVVDDGNISETVVMEGDRVQEVSLSLDLGVCSPDACGNVKPNFANVNIEQYVGKRVKSAAPNAESKWTSLFSALPRNVENTYLDHLILLRLMDQWYRRLKYWKRELNTGLNT